MGLVLSVVMPGFRPGIHAFLTTTQKALL